MTSPIRAAWALPFSFSDDQRSDLRALLRHHDAESTDRFLRAVEGHVSFLKGDWEIMGATPPEPPARGRAALWTIAKHASALQDALGNLDDTGSAVALAMALSGVGRGLETVEYLMHDLPLLAVSAEQGVRYIHEPRRGRPVDLAELNFIARVGKTYFETYGKVPTHSRGSTFPKFVATVLSFVLAGNPHGKAGPSDDPVDNSKLVRAALRAAGLVPGTRTTP